MPIKPQHLILPFAIAGVLSFTNAPTTSEQDLFDALDSDRDGELSLFDVTPLANVIPLLDKDTSDTVTIDEFRTRISYADVKIVEEDFYRGDVEQDTWTAIAAVEQSDQNKPGVAEPEIIASTLITMDLTSPGEVRFTTREATAEEITEADFVRVEFVAPQGAQEG